MVLSIPSSSMPCKRIYPIPVSPKSHSPPGARGGRHHPGPGPHVERLHGQILALLHGTPNVSLDYNYGKTRSFHETWTHRWDGALMAGSADEAARLARELL